MAHIVVNLAQKILIVVESSKGNERVKFDIHERCTLLGRYKEVMSGSRKWKRGDWEIEAASEIEKILGDAVDRNKSNMEKGGGCFVGVSLADMADIIEKHRTNKET